MYFVAPFSFFRPWCLIPSLISLLIYLSKLIFQLYHSSIIFRIGVLYFFTSVYDSILQFSMTKNRYGLVVSTSEGIDILPLTPSDFFSRKEIENECRLLTATPQLSQLHYYLVVEDAVNLQIRCITATFLLCFVNLVGAFFRSFGDFISHSFSFLSINCSWFFSFFL